MKKSLSLIVVAMLGTISVQANAALIISEVAPWGSNATNTSYATDWFELTNTGSSILNIAGWKMDDNSNSFASSVALTGISNIAAGESVIFTENAAKAAFLNEWFGGSAPAGLQIGNYTGLGVGLSQTADAVNIYNSSGVLQANVSFGVSGATSPLKTFDNAAGLNNTAISTLSATGVNGAFVAANNVNAIGSPGRIAAAVPEADTYAMFLTGLGLMGFISRRRQG